MKPVRNSPKTALIVETNYLIASAIELPLLDAGYVAVVAQDSEEALARLATQYMQLALIDFRQQYGHPDGLVARLKALEIPFIFCTAASSEEVAEAFPGARVLPKPFSDEQLLDAVSALRVPPNFGGI